MKSTLLVSLISDQTIPNVLLINEFRKQVSDYLFITTKIMEDKGIRKWIENTCEIDGSIVEVNQFSFQDIEAKLNDYDFDSFEKIIVNLTGGTKVMTLIAYDFFKRIGADIYYITGNENEYIKIFPVKKQNQLYFKEKVLLSDYLHSYGFNFEIKASSGISFEQSNEIYSAFLSKDLTPHINAIKFIQSKRAKKVNEDDFSRIDSYLSAINYKPIKYNKLSEAETKYLSGEWFEEYIGQKLKKELDLSDNDIFIGATIKKETPFYSKNNTVQLLGEQAVSSIDDFNNEMDVMFMYKNKFYYIECKTSIIAFKPILKNGISQEKEYNILGETIYKSDSLKNRFGLYSKTFIITLTDFKKYCLNKDSAIQNNKTRAMEEVIDRANISQIKLIDKSMLVNTTQISGLFI
jgi:hypothetical protein